MKHNFSILKDKKTYQPATFIDWLKQKFKDEKDIGKEQKADEFLEDALQGYGKFPEGNHLEAIDRLKNQVRSKYSKKTKTIPLALRVAAAIALPLTIIWLTNIWTKTPATALSDNRMNEKAIVESDESLPEEQVEAPGAVESINSFSLKVPKPPIRLDLESKEEEEVEGAAFIPKTKDVVTAQEDQEVLLEDPIEIVEEEMEDQAVENPRPIVVVENTADNLPQESEVKAAPKGLNTRELEEKKPTTNAKEITFYKAPIEDNEIQKKSKIVANQRQTGHKNDSFDTALALEQGINRSRSYKSGTKIKPAFKRKLETYIEEHLNYPTEALENKIEGIVLIRFNANKEGVLADFEILNSLGFGCDQEAIRLLKEGPKWPVPGDSQETPYIYPIFFKLSNK